MSKNIIMQIGSIVGLLILNSLIYSCVTTQKVAIVDGAFTHPVYKWSLSHLNGWKIKESSQYSVDFINESQQQYLSVHVIPVVFCSSVDKFAEYIGNTYPLPHFRLVSERTITLKNGLPALEIVHHIGTGVVGKSRKIVVIANGQGFLVDAETFLDSWDASEPCFKQIIDSFVVEGDIEGQKPKMEANYLYVLADISRLKGEYVEAESLYKQSREIREKILGLDHPDVASSLYGLALVYSEQRKYAEAEPIYEQALEIREKVLGPDHPDVGEILYSLALLYNRQGKYTEAEPLYERSLANLGKAYGWDHPYVGDPSYGLASVYKKQGRYAEAEKFFKRSLKILEKAYGPDNRNLTLSLSGLAEVYEAQGKYAEAESLRKRIQDIVMKPF